MYQPILPLKVDHFLLDVSETLLSGKSNLGNIIEIKKPDRSLYWAYRSMCDLETDDIYLYKSTYKLLNRQHFCTKTNLN